MSTPLTQTTGRRKEAVARARLREGSGVVTINGRAFDAYFPTAAQRMVVSEALRVADVEDRFDIDASIHGGGVSGQADALRMAIARSLVDLDPETRPALKRAGLLFETHERKSRRSTDSRRPARLLSTRSADQAARCVLAPTVSAGGRTANHRSDGIRPWSGHRSCVFGTPVVIGGDSRESTPAFITAVSQGLINGGAEVESLGIVPTPIVAAESSRRNAVGVVISASHNPFFDNGIKVFGPGGVKLSTETEAQIEAEWNRQDASDEVAKPSGNLTTGEMADVQVRYLERITSAIEQRSLQGIRVVIDAANGAASELAGEVFASVGADVIVIHADPNGTNINEGCGATHTQSLQEAVLAYGADVGLALDGDADRLIAVDHLGSLVDGDRVIAILASDMRLRGMLTGNTVVVTVMANLGFRRAMNTAGIEVVETTRGGSPCS